MWTGFRWAIWKKDEAESESFSFSQSREGNQMSRGVRIRPGKTASLWGSRRLCAIWGSPRLLFSEKPYQWTFALFYPLYDKQLSELDVLLVAYLFVGCILWGINQFLVWIVLEGISLQPWIKVTWLLLVSFSMSESGRGAGNVTVTIEGCFER